jgi:N-acetylmuramoyl-L-alanine amidase
MNVKEAAASCGTAAVNGLSKQLIAELELLAPNALDPVIDPNIRPASTLTVFLLLQPEAGKKLRQAVEDRGTPMRVNSCYRTLAQQYVLRHHAENDMCGIRAAAPPGHSNHEGGTGLDVASATGWKSFLEGRSWKKLGSFDPPHYDFIGRRDPMVNSFTVKAFQRLWNKHHPTDQLVVDGHYGNETKKRLEKSPAGGF